MQGKLKRLNNAFHILSKNQINNSIVSLQSGAHLKNIHANTIDYIFTDPPFGDNLMCSELNFLWEAWLKVITNNETDSLLLEATNSKKKIKTCRKEALAVGFQHCYQNERFQDILILAKKLDKKLIENNADINEFIEVAEIRIEGM